MSILKLIYPVQEPVRVAQEFGVNKTGIENFYTRWGLPAHEGIDFAGEKGDPIFAAADGIISVVAVPGGNGIALNHPYGKHIRIKHMPGGAIYETTYAHLSNFARLRQGMQVRAGELLGYMGNTGNVVKHNGDGGMHLHFMLKRLGATKDGEKQMALGQAVVYPNDVIDPTPYFQS